MSPINLLTNFFKRSASVKSSRRRSASRRLGLESLEKRQLHAIDVSLDPLGMLRIIGDEQHNYVDVFEEVGQLVVYTHRNRLDPASEGPQIKAFDLSKAKSIYFDGMAGDDYLLARVALPTVAFGGEGDDYLLGGKGRNQLYGESGSNSIGLFESTPSINTTIRGPVDQSPIAVYYRQFTDDSTGQTAASLLGQSTNNGQEYVSADGQAKMRTYENGVIVWTTGHGAVHLVGNILKKWESLGGFNNVIVGNPTSPEFLYSNSVVNRPDDTIQKFEHGVIVNRPGVGDRAYEIHGEIYNKWMESPKDAIKPRPSNRSLLGLPRSDELPTINGKGQESRFDGGTIKWVRATNTTTVLRPFSIRLVSPANALNNTLLFLTSVAPARLGGLSMSTATNNFYTTLGREKGVLGAHVAGERLIGGKMVFVTTFRFGAIYRTMNSIFEVHGDIYKKYMQMGGPAGDLGLPRSNETAVGDTAGGRFSHFEYGAIFWTPTGGAFEVRGEIQKAWDSLNNVRGSLGYPTSDELDVSVNSTFRISTFQNGVIVYSMQTGTVVMQGEAWLQWRNLGGTKSLLGAPTSVVQNVFVFEGVFKRTAQRMQFEGGTMTFRAGAAATFDFSFVQMKYALQQVAADGATVTQADINLLHSFRNGGNTMPDYVRNLLGKLLDGDRANIAYRHTVLGNLAVNNPSWQLQRLTDQWFGGLERPRAVAASFGITYGYEYAEGDLFGPLGPRSLDIDQGAIGNCYLMASLSSLAAKTPQTIRDMIIDNGDDTFSVRFFNKGKAEYVTVDRALPTDFAGRLVYASEGRFASLGMPGADNSPLWVAIIEKAYVIATDSGWINNGGFNDYGISKQDNGINGGNASETLAELANINATEHMLISFRTNSDGTPHLDAHGNQSVDLKTSATLFQSLLNDLKHSSSLYSILSTPDTVSNSQLIGAHVYVVLATGDTGLTLFNPWGLSSGTDAVFQLTWAEAAGNFDQWTRF